MEGPFSNLLPSGWHLTHLILLDPEWQAIAKDEEHVAAGTGDTIEEAFATLTSRIANDDFLGRLFHLPSERSELAKAPSNLLASLGLVEQPLLRRKVT